MTNKHLRNHQPVALALLVTAAIAGCRNTVDDQDAGPQCPAGEIFVYEDALCGKGSSAGFCREPAISCDDSYAVCGCDGTVYQSLCAAHQAGVGRTFADQCTAPPDMFACGYTYCARNTEFCLESVVESGGGGFYCEPMQPKCASAPSCGCLLESYDECESDGMGGFHVTEILYTGP